MGTKHRGPAREVRALNAFIALVRASESVNARLQPLLDRANLTVSQFGALEALRHLGPLRPREIGVKLLKSGGNVTMVVANLERRGLVRRVRTPDRRTFSVRLTPAGGRLIRRIFPRHVAGVVREFAVLSPSQQEEMRRLCKALGTQRRPS